MGGYELFAKIVKKVRLLFPKMVRNMEIVMRYRSCFKWVPYQEFTVNGRD